MPGLRTRLLLGVMLAMCLVTGRASADVNVPFLDDVWLDLDGTLIMDDPLTPFYEGVPKNGNTIDWTQAMAQTGYEGKPNDTNTANINFHIIVGRSASGQMILSGPFSMLRDQDLIIGDKGPRQGQGDREFEGNGTVRIEGNGALYNNDPTILPWPLTVSPSVNPRPLDVGFDVYVGRNGTGRLRLALGGRAEIQDAVIVGDSPSADGILEVDGFDSMLRSGGFPIPSGTPTDEVHQLVVGHLGHGEMRITNGGLVFSDSPDTTSANALIGAVIGGDPYLTGQIPQPGGNGYVYVSGNNSRWDIQGSLQIGGFDNVNGPFGPDSNESEGDNVTYGNSVGHGTMYVETGAAVNLLPVDTEVQTISLDMLLGRFGEVVMRGGRVSVGGNVGDPEVGARSDLVRILNDGNISGDGRIDTGLIYNRYQGEINVRADQVHANQHLIIEATSTYVDTAFDSPPMVNWGVIRVIGDQFFRAELDFERNPFAPGLPAPLQNRALTVQPLVGRRAGFIHVQNGTVRFRTGVENQGTIAFTGGSNQVLGNIVNLVGDTPASIPNGLISVTGIGTHVLFEDNLVNGGHFSIGYQAAPVDILGDFTQVFSADPIDTGTLILQLQVGQASRLNIVGDAFLGGTLEASIVGPAPAAGDSYGILSATGDVLGIFHSQVLPTLAPTLGWTVDYNYVLDTVVLRVLSLASVSGADFNGDGVVDYNDLLIWQTNYGIVSGASPLQGDADGDGDVDGDDYIIWQTTPGPVPGSGSGSQVPEPASFVLLASIGWLAAFYRRRKP